MNGGELDNFKINVAEGKGGPIKVGSYNYEILKDSDATWKICALKVTAAE